MMMSGRMKKPAMKTCKLKMFLYFLQIFGHDKKKKEHAHGRKEAEITAGIQ